MTMKRWRLAEPKRNHEHQNEFSSTSDLKGIKNPRTTLNLFPLFILKPTSTLWHLETDKQKNDPSKYTFGLFFNTRTLHLEQALIQVWNPWRVRRGSVTIFIPSHTLFLWTVLWTLSYRNNNLLISWSYLLILLLRLWTIQTLQSWL